MYNLEKDKCLILEVILFFYFLNCIIYIKHKDLSVQSHTFTYIYINICLSKKIRQVENISSLPESFLMPLPSFPHKFNYDSDRDHQGLALTGNLQYVSFVSALFHLPLCVRVIPVEGR